MHGGAADHEHAPIREAPHHATAENAIHGSPLHTNLFADDDDIYNKYKCSYMEQIKHNSNIVFTH